MALESVTSPAQRLRTAAEGLLRRNDLGGRTLAAPDLYPHQWSWDSAFIALGWARIDVGRAARELETLLAAQWANGKVPHIIFNPAAPPGSYWPGPEHWTCEVPADAPEGCTPHTSGLCQPPVHALAAARLWRVASSQDSRAADRARSFLGQAFPRLMAWHAYLLTLRDQEGSGLVSICHPWESGMDNSPRWDVPLAAVHPLADGAGDRPDLRVVGDPGQRPLGVAYGQYRWLVQLLRRHCYDDVAARTWHPFLVKDVFASGLLFAANQALLRIAGVVGAGNEDRRRIRAWIDRGRQGLRRSRDPRTGLARDYDLRARRWLSSGTVAGFAELIAGTARGLHYAGLVRHLGSGAFTGHPRLRWAVPPSTSPLDPGFHQRRYWRGPTWPVIAWLLWWALEEPAAERLRQACLDQIWCSGVFPEYLDPFTGEPLGSPQQSWTAAVALDWLASGTPARGMRGHTGRGATWEPDDPRCDGARTRLGGHLHGQPRLAPSGH